MECLVVGIIVIGAIGTLSWSLIKYIKEGKRLAKEYKEAKIEAERKMKEAFEKRLLYDALVIVNDYQRRKAIFRPVVEEDEEDE